MKKLLFILSVFTCLTLASCGGDEPDSKYDDITLKSGATYTIKGSNGSWKSSNEYIATVSGNTVTAKCVGEATISGQKGSFKVTVIPTTELFAEPYMQWGASKSAVKSFMKNATPYEDSTTKLLYQGTGATILTQYIFESNRLKSAGVALNSNYVSSEALVNMLFERYVPLTIDQEDYMVYMHTPDEKTVIGVSVSSVNSTAVYIVVYVPFTSSKSVIPHIPAEFFNFVETDAVISDEAINAFNNLKAQF